MNVKSVSGSNQLNYLLISANVGTLFEKLQELEEVWLGEFLKVIKKHQAHFIALHCQEIGGKDYKTLFDPVVTFFKKLTSLDELKDFTISQTILDGDVNETDQFTALGSLYLVHKCVEDVSLYNFESKRFFKPLEKSFASKNIMDLSCVRKEKFDLDFFPECNWTRKGYCWMRWKINGQIIDLVNVHLFHDDSNLKAVSKCPSQYTAYRARAFKHVMSRVYDDQHMDDRRSLFLFGDFNFRLDVKPLVESLCSDCSEQVVRSADDDNRVTRIVYRDRESNAEKVDFVLKLEKKFFQVHNPSFQPQISFEKLRRFDNELSRLNVDLKEYDVTFPPTYPYSESIDHPDQYMATRCPSWCDRILLSHSAWDWLQLQQESSEVVYSVVGESVCMGDHKPVYLAFTTSSEQGVFQSNGEGAR